MLASMAYMIVKATNLSYRDYINELWPPPSGTLGLNSADTTKQGQTLKPMLWKGKKKNNIGLSGLKG